MALIFAESCDEAIAGSGQQSQLNSGWTYLSGSSMNNVTDRYGTSKAWQGSGSNLLRTFDAADQHGTVILGFAVNWTSLASQKELWAFRDPSGNVRATLWFEPVTGGAAVVVRVGTLTTGLILATSGTVTPAIILGSGVWAYVEVKYVTHASTGAVTIKVGEAVKGSATGIDTTGAFAGATLGQLGFLTSTSGSTVNVDDIYVCNGAGSAPTNDFLGDCRVPRLRANANGDSSQWVGTDANSVDNYLQMDDVPPATSIYNRGLAVNDKDLYGMVDTPVALAGKTVFGVCVRQAIWCDFAPRGVSPVVKTATEEVKTEITLDTTVGKTWIRVEEQQPGATAWTTAALDSAQFGVKVTT